MSNRGYVGGNFYIRIKINLTTLVNKSRILFIIEYIYIKKGLI